MKKKTKNNQMIKAKLKILKNKIKAKRKKTSMRKSVFQKPENQKEI